VCFSVVLLDEAFDLLDELLDVSESAAADGPLRDEVEPYLYLVEPGGVRRRVVD